MMLYEIARNYLDLLELEGEIDEQTFKDTLESVEFEVEEKADNIAKLIQLVESKATMIKNEEERLAKKRKVLENKATYIKDNLYQTMKALGLDTIKNDLFNIKIKKNPHKLIIEDIAELEAYTKEVVEVKKIIDNAKIKEDLKNGVEIKGARLEQGERLEIK